MTGIMAGLGWFAHEIRGRPRSDQEVLEPFPHRFEPTGLRLANFRKSDRDRYKTHRLDDYL
jgi:hypothetical protein